MMIVILLVMFVLVSFGLGVYIIKIYYRDCLIENNKILDGYKKKCDDQWEEICEFRIENIELNVVKLLL